jgi:hypothetical protein
MSKNVVRRTLPTTGGDTTATGWIPLNTHQENFHVGFSIIHFGPGKTPAMNVKGTMVNTIANTSVAAERIFPLVSAPGTNATGTIVLGEITFPIAGIRLETISGGSATSTLEFDLIQTGKV